MDSGDDVRGSMGSVVLAATPLGNPADASYRLRDLIHEATVIAAEDTRRFRRLASDLRATYTARVVSFYESVEKVRIPDLIDEASNGGLVLLLTDAGMPSISDPGYSLVAACIKAGVPLTVAPGPSALTCALALSGLPSDRFCFEGFLPRKPGERTRRLNALAAEQRTMVFFESPHRIDATLEAMAIAFGDNRSACVCRELTKTYEEVHRGTFGELIDWAQKGLKGEITIVVAGAPPELISTEPVVLASQVRDLVESGLDKKTATAQVAIEAGVPKKVVYDAVLARNLGVAGVAEVTPDAPSPQTP